MEELENIIEEETTIKNKTPQSYIFICPNCKKTICINSDLYTKIEDKKSQHVCYVNSSDL